MLHTTTVARTAHGQVPCHLLPISRTRTITYLNLVTISRDSGAAMRPNQANRGQHVGVIDEVDASAQA